MTNDSCEQNNIVKKALKQVIIAKIVFLYCLTLPF